jgi:hypothetical protein
MNNILMNPRQEAATRGDVNGFSWAKSLFRLRRFYFPALTVFGVVFVEVIKN